MKKDKNNIELAALDSLKDYLGITREEARDLIGDVVEFHRGEMAQIPSINADELLSKSSKKPSAKKGDYLN